MGSSSGGFCTKQQSSNGRQLQQGKSSPVRMPFWVLQGRREDPYYSSTGVSAASLLGQQTQKQLASKICRRGSFTTSPEERKLLFTPGKEKERPVHGTEFGGPWIEWSSTVRNGSLWLPRGNWWATLGLFLTKQGFPYVLRVCPNNDQVDHSRKLTSMVQLENSHFPLSLALDTQRYTASAHGGYNLAIMASSFSLSYS